MKFPFAFFSVFVLVSCSEEVTSDDPAPVVSSYTEMYDPIHTHVSSVDNLDSVIFHLASDSTVRDRHVGIGGAQCETYAYYIRLKEIAGEDTLVDLINNPNPVLRVYAYWALIDLNYPKCAALLSVAKNDHATVPFMSGCLVSQDQVSELVDRKWRETHLNK